MGVKELAGEFNFHGQGLSLRVPPAHAGLLEEAEHFWQFFHAPAATSRPVTVQVHAPASWAAVATLERPDAEIAFDGLRCYFEGDCFVIGEPGVTVVGMRDRIDAYLQAGRGHDYRRLVRVTLNLALLEALRHHRLFYLHGACLKSPAGKTYLISGDAGRGKSTLTLALLMEGYGYLSDDAVFLDARSWPVRVVAYAKLFHLANDQRERIPAVALPQWSGRKWEFDPAAAFPGQRLRSVDRVDVLVLPEISGGETSEVVPVGQAEALTHFFGTSTQVFFDKSLAAVHLRALRTVATRARAYRLRAGRDVYADPSRYHALLRSL
jgi:hypothetical protein